MYKILCKRLSPSENIDETHRGSTFLTHPVYDIIPKKIAIILCDAIDFLCVLLIGRMTLNVYTRNYRFTHDTLTEILIQR